MTLRTRFALITGGLVFLIATVMSFGAYRIASSQLERQVQTSLEQRITRILEGRGPLDRAIEQTEVDAITQVILPGNQVLRRRDYPELPYDKALELLSHAGKRIMTDNIVIDGHTFRMMTVLTDNGSLIQVAKDTQILIDARNGMRTWFPILASLAVIVSALFGWLFAGRVSRPIEILASTAEEIAATQNLERRIASSGNDEVGQLAKSFNTMLAALGLSMSRQRQLVQDASHELRTPLTSLRANSELLERGSLSDEDRASILIDMRAEIDELTALSTELSALAIDQRSAETPETIDLSAIADEVAARSSRRAGVVVSVHSTSDFMVTARPHQLERAISNLVDNALKFNVASTEVEIHVGAKRVEVRDHGPGISDVDKPLVFDRFYRATATRSMPGSGLGLSIVAQFAQDHDATAYVLDNAGGGAIVGIQFTK